MLTLSLLRHAKSAWDDPSIRDFDRPLAPRGKEAAPRMAAFMARRGVVPDLVLCSPAMRARQTLELVLPHLSGSPRVEYEDALYLAAVSVLLARIRKLGADIGHVMIVGHDPGMHGLALELAATGEPEEMAALAAKFPTTGLAVITFRVREWRKVGPGKGHLQLFMAPKRLP